MLMFCDYNWKLGGSTPIVTIPTWMRYVKLRDDLTVCVYYGLSFSTIHNHVSRYVTLAYPFRPSTHVFCHAVVGNYGNA